MPRMGKPGQAPGEKSKDFFGSSKKLIKSLSGYKTLIIISLLLAAISATLSIISPDKLSELTDTISAGIIPNTEKLTDISTLIISNTDKDDIYYEGNIISYKDQIKFMSIASKLKDSQDLSDLNKLPKSIYKVVKPQIDMTKVKELFYLLVFFYAISFIFGFIQEYIMTTVSNKYAQKLRSNINNKINKLPLKYFDSHETGDILSRITNDVDTINQNLDQSLATIIISLTLFIGSIIMMFVTNWIMAIAAIISSLIGFVFMALILSKSQKYFVQKQSQLGDLNGFIEEIYSGHNVVKVYNGSKEASEKFKKLNNKLYVSNYKSSYLSGLMGPFMGFIGNLGYVVVCIVGALLVIKGKITFGVIVAFIIYVRLFSTPLSRMGQAATSLQTCVAASERVFEFIEETEQSDESKLIKKLQKEDVKGSIEFKNVKFGYNDERIIIKDFSAKVKPGQKIALVGPTGAGKTTIVNLLMKFYEINGGDILIDGTSIKELTRENIHNLFCMVLQDTWLFSGTIKENVKFNSNATDEEIIDACKTVGVYHFIKTLPKGINATLDDNDTVSQGQKQLLTIARGMLENAPFLILDEATSNVDTRTEELVQKAMDKLTKGKTSFIIAHRLSTIKNADLILVMKDGNIIEQGTHEKLLKQKGFYAELYNSQFEL